MSRLTLPKNPYKGLKIFCKTCNKDNSNCKHFDSQVYRVRIHIPGTKNSVKTKKLQSTEYRDALKEILKFEEELYATDFTTIGNTIIDKKIEDDKGNDYSLADAVIRYHQYLNGESNYSHLKKNVSAGHRKELLRYCRYFSQNVHKSKDITRLRVRDVSRDEVSKFYSWAENKYSEKTLKKCMSTLKGFFEFLIDIEEIEMRNPFRTYVIKGDVVAVVETINKEEFQAILTAVDDAKDDDAKSMAKSGTKGKKRNMYRPYLKNAYELFLLTGCRREELVVMKWSDICSFDENVKFLYIDNIKVQRIKNRKNDLRPIPITPQLMDLLIELKYNDKYMTDDYILCPERDMNLQSFMDFLSKSFTHFWKSTGIKKDYSLKNLRKTHFTWVNKVMGDETKILSSHSTNDVLKKFYLDPKLSPIIAKGAAEIKIFG